MKTGVCCILRRCIVGLALVFACSYALAQSAARVEAEDASLAGSLAVYTNVAGYEGTGFVGSFANATDQLTVTFPNVTAGYYDVRIRYHSSNQANVVWINGTARTEMFADTSGSWSIKTISSISLVSGSNTVSITKDWGWIEVDYIEIVPGSAPTGDTPTHIEAEHGVLSGSLTVRTDVAGYDGTGFVGSFANAADQLSVSFQDVVAGLYDIRIRYHSGTQVNTVIVNGVTRSEMFADTSGGWAVKTITRTALVAGTNTIAIAKEWGWIDIDYIELAPRTTGSGDTPTHIEAENGVLGGTLKVQGDVPGYQGSGFVARFMNAGDQLTVQFPDVAAGSYDLRIRYHSGTQQNTVAINGSSTSEMFAGTGDAWGMHTIPAISLVNGTNTVVISKDWGWIDIDYVEIAPIAGSPTITVSRTPSPMTAGQAFTLSWSSSNATSVTRSCVASGTGFSGNTTMSAVSGSESGTALAAWVGFPSTCTWSATGAGGVATFTETMTTNASPAGTVRYYYDEPGRLVQVVAPDGQGARYVYDAVGNILSISRFASTTVSISEFTPNAGPVGAGVTIVGSGFSSNPANNTVTFNGTAATIVAATATSLSVTVPAGATSGAIAVTSANGSATSSVPFAVDNATSAPTISGFSPAMGPVGTIVSVSGTNFQVAAANNKAALSGITAAVQTDASSPTATLLKIVVPNGPPSGKISITTPFGKATSAADFFGLPATINAADVEFSGRLTVEGPAVNVVTTSPGKKAVLLFDGSPGQGLHLVSASGTFAAGISAVVYAPDGSVLDTLSLSNQGLLNFSRLPFGLSAGSYAIVLSPQATDKGSISLSLIADVTGTLTVDGMTPVSFSGGRSARFSFTAEAGKGYGLALTGYTISPSANLAVTLRKADGGSQSTCYVSNPSATCSFAPSLFATAGTYMIDFVPGGLSAVAFDAAFSKDTGGALTVDAPAATTMTIARAGQNGRYTFSGTAGDSMSVVLTNMQGIGGTTNVQVLRPSNGASIGSMNVSNSQGGNLNVTLPETGIYTVLVDNLGLYTGTIDVQVKSFATGQLAVDGTTAVNLSAGRTGRYSFTAEAGKGYGLGLVGYTMTPSASLYITLRKADGTALTNCNIYSAGGGSCSFAPSLFATAGTYMIDFVPGGPSAVAFDAAFSKDTGGALTVDASAATTMTIARAGQNGRYTFSGTAGGSVSVVLTNMQGIAGTTSVRVFRPSDGASIGSMNVSNSQGGNLNVTLPETGIYTLFIDNWGLYTGTIDVHVKSFATGQLAVDGTTAVNLSAGRTGRYSFTAEAGKGYGLGLVGYTITPSESLHITLRKADGTALTNCNIYSAGGGSCSFAPSLFATAGTYMIDFVPGGPSAVAFDAAFSKDTGGALTVDASAATTMTIARAGQNGRYTFSGTASQAVSVTLSNMQGISSTTNVRLYRPSDGASVGSWNFYSGQGGTLNVTLPETGTYTLFIDNLGLDTGTLDVRVTSN